MITNFWPTSVEAQNWTFFLSLIGMVVILLLIERYVLDRILDWWQRDQVRANAAVHEQLKADLAERRKLSLVSRTGSDVSELRRYSMESKR